MNVLVVGSGGREHTLAWKIAQSNRCDTIFIAPGNAGTESIGTNLPISVNNFEALAHAIKENEIKLVIIGPEDPLVNGLRDYLHKVNGLENLLIVGPGKDGAKLEGSKDFSKDFMEQYGIPTAASKTFTKENIEDGYAYIDAQKAPIVVKADGLAAGKGVIIAQTAEEAKDALRSMLLENKFAEAGQKVLIEQFLDGIELSVFVLADGENYKILPEAKDYKRIGENDTGLNTGGMGAVSPVPFATADYLSKVEERVVKPTLEGLKSRGINYIGFIFIGLMNVDSEPYVIEYNVRMGDPETQVVIPRLDCDLLGVLEAAASGSLNQVELSIKPEVATTVVAVAGGYPEAYDKGNLISGLESNLQATIFHAGTQTHPEGIVTNGGRVIAATGTGGSIQEALNNSYSVYSSITWKDIYFRKDIGQDLLNL